MGIQPERIPDADLLNGTITGYGQPLMDFREQYGIGNTAWVASYNWRPPMFRTDWTFVLAKAKWAVS